MLNVRDASVDQISKNAEIQNIKQFMGLQHKKEYTRENLKTLRYGHLMIMTDQDHDGSHIKGLLINFLQVQFPSLLKIEGFLLEFITPIVKVWKGDPKFPKAKKDFFTLPEYEAWRQEPGHDKGWEHKYYKGLGTSDTRDAETYFSDLDKHLKTFHTMQDKEVELIDLAFSKKKADDRKQWLQKFVPGTFLDMSGKEKISYDDFINKELILFSMADNFRSIPSLVDGFKPGQRKILYTALRRNLKKDIKVVELAGQVMGQTAYAYGETSLQQTIVGLAQTFVGSNNINVLEPSGNFGSRLQGGSDAASARYIYTRLSPFARRIFNAHDEPLLTYNTDDGKTIEPETYIPVVPMVLINGADGIGTGWSTSIPNYNPADVIENIRLRMAGSSKADMKPMQPWFRGWEGEVEDIGNGRFKFTGTIVHKDANTVEVTEWPVRFWTQDFKAHLEEIIKAEKTPSFIKDYSEYNTPEKVHFIITLDDKGMKVALEKGLEDQFKLSRTMATTNLVAFDGQGRIHKYETPLDIMEEFYHIRLAFYEKRKQYLLNEMQKELEKLSNQSRFVQMIIDGKLVVSKKKKSVLVAELHKLNFKPIPKLADAKKQGETEDALEDDDDSEDAAPGANDFDYLLGMAIWSLTQERVEKLLKQIGDKETEIDALIKLSPKDLWTKDLDELLEEWHTQLQVEATRAKKSKGKGRRTSQKLGVLGNSKKRKSDDSDDDDDDDFVVSKKAKTAAKSAAASKTAPAARSKVSKGATGLLDNFLVKPTTTKSAGVFPVVDGIEQQPVEAPPAVKAGLIEPSEITKPLVRRKMTKIEDSDDDDIEMATKPVAKAPARRIKTALDTDDEEEVAPVRATAKPAAKPAPRKKPVIESDSGDDDIVMFDAAKMKPAAQAAPASRGGRAAAKKPVKYAADSDEDMSDDDLGDISKMVKEIPSAAPGRSLLSNSTHRTGASHGIKSSHARKESVEPVDDTDWAELAKGTPAKPIAQATAVANYSDDEDANMDDDSILLSTRKPQPLKTISKTATKATASTTAKAKKPAVAPVKTLSPAAKAYAAKQSKAAAAKPAAKAPASRKKTALDSEDEDEDLANDILSDDDETMASASSPVATAARPSRRAAAAKPKAKYVVDDEDEEDEEEDDFEEEDEEEETFNDDSE